MELAQYWAEAPPLAVCVRAYFGMSGEETVTSPDEAPKEISQEEFDRMVAGLKQMAESQGRGRLF